MNTYKNIARVTGVLYLLIFITAGFSEGFVRASLIVPNDAVATVANILESESLFRWGFASDLVAFMTDAAVSILLYVLLKPASKTVALIAAAFRLIAHPAIGALNLLNHFSILTILSGSSYLSAFDGEQLNALVMIFLNAHKYGYFIAGAFFGVHCLLLGYLLYKSEFFPKVLGILMAIASIGYLVESFGNFVLPEYESFFAMFVVIPAVAGELSLTLFLLMKGVKTKLA